MKNSINHAQAAPEMVLPTITGNLEANCLAYKGVARLVDKDGNDACAKVKETTTVAVKTSLKNTSRSVQEANDSYLPELTGVLAISLILGSIIQTIRTKGTSKRVSPVNIHSISQASIVPPINYSMQAEMTEKGKEGIAKSFQDTFLTSKDGNREKDKFSVALAFLSRTSEIDTYIINKLRSAVLGKALDNKDQRPQILERALWTLRTLGFDIKNNTRASNHKETNDPTELEDLITILGVIKASIELATPTQSPPSPAPGDTDSSD